MEQMAFPNAREFAIEAHGRQKYGGFPYSVHLRDVVNVLKRFDVCSPDLEAAAWLHDALEDTTVRSEDIQRLFGDRVLALVQAVTNEPGANRKERAIKTYPKIRRVGRDAVILKLADRIANVEYSVQEASGHLKMYRKEFPEFSTALFEAGECDEMWDHLRGLSCQ